MINKRVFSFILVFSVYMILICQNYMLCDDYWDSWNHATGQPILGLGDAIQSQMHDYMEVNGRFIIHTITQYLSGMRALWFVRIINGLCVVGIFYIISNLVSYEDRNRSLSAVLSLSLLLFIPSAGNTFLSNIAFSVNYIWTALLNVLFIYYINKNYLSPPKIKVFIFALLSLITGAMQESFSIGVCLALLVNVIANRSRMNGCVICMTLAYFLGSVFLVLAPGNFVRAESAGVFTSHFLYTVLQGVGRIVLYAHAFSIMIVVLLFSFWFNRKKTYHFLRENCLLFFPAFGNMLFAAFVVMTGPHQLVCVELFSLIVLLKLFYGYWNSHKLSQFYDSALQVVSVFSVLVLLVPIYYYRYQVGCSYEKMIDSAKNSTDGTMISTEYDNWCFSKRNWFVKHYTTTEYDQPTTLKILSLWLSGCQNDSLINCRLPLPKSSIISLCEETNEISPFVYHRSNDFFFIVRDRIDETSNAFPKCTKICELSFLQSLRSSLFGRDLFEKEIDLSVVSHFDSDNYRYYIINDNDRCPIKSIKLVPKTL